MSFINQKIKGELIDGYQNHGFLIPGKKKKLIIGIHGMSGNFYRNILVRMSSSFTNQGWGILLVNTRGHDSMARCIIRKGKKTEKKCLGTIYEKFEDSFYDIQAAVNIAYQLGYKRIILLGHSTGCQKIAYYIYRTKDKRVNSLILLAPGDDYNINKKSLGKKWSSLAEKAKKLMQQKKESQLLELFPEFFFSAQRFNSVSDLKRIESRLFNYEGNLKEFSAITPPIIALFGSADEHLVKPANKCLSLLKKKTGSKSLKTIIIKDADHGFKDHEKETAEKIIKSLED